MIILRFFTWQVLICQFQGLATLHNIQVEMTDQIKIHTTASLIL